METRNIKSICIDIGTVFLIVVGISLIVVSFLGQAGAEEVPSKSVLRAENLIKENQDVISETRDAHIQFMTAKDDNEYQVRRLRDQCYEFDWKTMKAVKISDCTPSDLLE